MKRVALLIETSRSYGRELLRGIQRYAVQHGPWSTFVEVRDLESRPPAWLSRWDGDGILVRSGSAAIARAVRAVNVPAVELRSTTHGAGFPFVGIDNERVGWMVADHLLDRGLQHFGVFELDTEAFFVERRDSFVRRLREQGKECSAFRQSGHSEKPSQWETQQKRLSAWLSDLPKPAGIMACTDQLGCWLLDASRRCGLRVPEDIAVVGVENDETLTMLSTPPLSSVQLPGEAVGMTAAALLDRMMRRRVVRTAQKLLPPLGIVTRQSSDVVAVEDRLLGDAIRVMRERASGSLRVADILAAVPISRSALERGCRAVLGRSPNQEISRVRLERGCELLRSSDMTLDEIAREVGYASAPYFLKVFREAFGTTPGAWRKAARNEG